MDVLADIIRVAYLGRVAASVADANIAAVVSGLDIKVYNPEPGELLADVGRAWGLYLNPFSIKRALGEAWV